MLGKTMTQLPVVVRLVEVDATAENAIFRVIEKRRKKTERIR